MNYTLFDDLTWHNLLPLTFTKPVSEIRIGILTITEKWEHFLNCKMTFQSQSHLQEKYALPVHGETLFINGSICPDSDLVKQISHLETGEGIKSNGKLIAFRCSENRIDITSALNVAKEVEARALRVDYVWDIFSKNGEAIKSDFALLTHGRNSLPLSSTNTVIGNTSEVFIEEGAIIEAAILNTKSGPIYVGKDSEIMEGSVVRGPFALCEHSALKLGTKVYGPTTIGPYSKVGGEINNSVIFGFSNKAHDGFLGNSVIGEWCNLGADSNNSNLKNNYGNVKLFSYVEERPVDTGLQFCGLIMGDHSKCGINTMFNTGTVAGVGANIFGGGFPPTHIPDFSWGGAEGMEEYRFDKMLETAQRVYARRGLKISEDEKKILETIFKDTKKFRN
ncbi:MAG: glucose-phosphate thymidylyltransferase [Bacteroidota bacterium]|jgi:UDP-N-acetylglucosamine diphosphorylase/glucosamine-1-phosphate N-acetyltransferase|nr:glucose-phosphate thymidylyltransferase [Bacteroidota bacterium]